MQEQIRQVQEFLTDHNIDGWLLYEFGYTNSIARNFLRMQRLHVSRRFFYFIPQEGEPTIISGIIEPHVGAKLPGRRVNYHGRAQLQQALEETLDNCSCVCMEYSPDGAIPYLSKVDAGTIELVKSCGVSVVSSGFLLGKLTSTLSEEQIQTHCEVAAHLQEIVQRAFSYIGDHVGRKGGCFEGDVRDFILDEFGRCGLDCEDAPIVARGSNSAKPHYFPKEKGEVIVEDDLIMIDLWAKLALDGSIYADITRMGCVGEPTKKQVEVFDVVLNAQQAAIEFIQERVSDGAIVKGFEVDIIARDVIQEAGYGPYFIHRLGHNIGTELHGHGTHLDSFETLDDRPLLSRTCFSIEPGIYLPGEFGIRLETDVLIDENGEMQITGGLQNQIACIE